MTNSYGAEVNSIRIRIVHDAKAVARYQQLTTNLIQDLTTNRALIATAPEQGELMTRIDEEKPVLVCRWTNLIDVGKMTPAERRHLDGYIAERYYGWKLTKVPRDCNGANECEVLTPDGTLHERVPVAGKIDHHRFVPPYTRDLKLAAQFAQKMGYHDLQFGAEDLVQVDDLPELVVRSVIAAIGSEEIENDQSQRDEE